MISVNTLYSYIGVALLAEGVDRNTDMLRGGPVLLVVALLAEGVDRNVRRTAPNAWP